MFQFFLADSCETTFSVETVAQEIGLRLKGLGLKAQEFGFAGSRN